MKSINARAGHCKRISEKRTKRRSAFTLVVYVCRRAGGGAIFVFVCSIHLYTHGMRVSCRPRARCRAVSREPSCPARRNNQYMYSILLFVLVFCWQVRVIRIVCGWRCAIPYKPRRPCLGRPSQTHRKETPIERASQLDTHTHQHPIPSHSRRHTRKIHNPMMINIAGSRARASSACRLLDKIKEVIRHVIVC